MSDRNELLWLLVLFVVGVAYGFLGSGLSLDWVDEGQVVYMSWRVSEGAVPYRDFQNIYGPSVFLLNGWLFRLFGEDLWVIRVSLTLLKGTLAIVVYLCTIRLGPRPIAVGAWLLCVVVWGLPWPYFTTPYANFYGVSLSLGGILALASLRQAGRNGSAYLIAGLCFGIAATFKQTNGLFAYCAVMLHLLSLRRAPAIGTPGGWSRFGSGLSELVISLSRWLVLGFCAVLFVTYLGRGNTASNFALLLAPAAVALAALTALELRSPATREVRLAALRSMLVLSLAAALPILAVAIGFGVLGLLPALVYNTMFGLPQKLDWLVPLSGFSWEMGLFTLGLAGTAVSIRCGIADGTAPSRERGVAGVWLAVALVATCAVVFGVARHGRSWVFAAADLVVAVPFLLVGGGLSVAIRQGSAAEEIWLFALYGATAVLYFYPSADPAHVMLSLPAMLPLLAPCFGRASRAAPSAWDDRSSWAAALALGLIALPFVYLQAMGRVIEQVPRPGFDRASGIEVGGELYRDGARLVRYLEREGVRQRPLLVISGKPMVYFLADRSSPIDASEFELYLIGLGVLTGENARELVDEGDLIEVLHTVRPLLVTDSSDNKAARVYKALPRLRAEVEEHFAVLERVGLFTLLEHHGPAGGRRDRQLRDGADSPVPGLAVETPGGPRANSRRGAPVQPD